MTVLEQRLDEYLQLRRTLGHKLADAHRVLPWFVTYLDQRDIEFVTTETALAWSLERDVPDGSVVPAHRMIRRLKPAPSAVRTQNPSRLRDGWP